jgi:hypothetical protein
VRRIGRLMLPALFGVSVAQLSLLIDTLLASFLTTGSISWLYYSDRLMEFPLGILGVALGTVILPRLAGRAFNRGQNAMRLIRGLHNLRDRDRGCVATIGNFDGVHLGHRTVFQRLLERGRRARPAGHGHHLRAPAHGVFQPGRGAGAADPAAREGLGHRRRRHRADHAAGVRTAAGGNGRGLFHRSVTGAGARRALPAGGGRFSLWA